MKTKKVLVLGGVMSLLICFAAIGAAPYIWFGKEGMAGSMRGWGFERYAGLVVVPAPTPSTPTMTAALLENQDILRQVGGGLLVSVAEPAPDMANTKLALRYESDKPDGARVTTRLAGKPYTFEIYDWELKPLVDFVNSGHSGAISAQEEAEHVTITLDGAFQGTLLGLRFIQADLLPVGLIVSQTFLPRDESGPLLGPGERAHLARNKEADEAAYELIDSVLSNKVSRYVVLTDAGRKFRFELQNGVVAVSGRPFYYAWNPAANAVKPDKKFNETMKASWDLLLTANPVVVRSMTRAFRAVSFFRYQQKQSSEDWASFSLSVSKIQLPEVLTPRYLDNEL